jgi:Flp pilus assembly protein TadG
MKKILSGLRASRSGNAVVEVAVVLSFLLLVLFGIIDFGRAFWHSNILHTACREGARMMAVTAQSAGADSVVTNRINDVLSTAGIVPEPGDIQLIWPVGPGSSDPVTVTINYDFKLIAGPILGIVPGKIPLSARCVMRYEAGS